MVRDRLEEYPLEVLSNTVACTLYHRQNSYQLS